MNFIAIINATPDWIVLIVFGLFVWALVAIIRKIFFSHTRKHELTDLCNELKSAQAELDQLRMEIFK